MMERFITADILRFTISAAVIIEGLDKFFNLLVDWKIYVPSQIADLWPFSIESFLWTLGVTEILIGIMFILSSRLGALLVAGLMAGIIFNLLLLANFYNMILLNTVIGLAALFSASISKQTNKSE